MLKLMKYEMIHSVRTFTTSFLVFLLGCVIMPFAIYFLGGNQSTELVLGILGFIFMVLVMGITLALFISVFINFKRSMFEKPGYLTLTLPKSNIEILTSKLIVSIIWITIGSLVLFGGFLLMMFLVSVLEGTLNITEIFDIIGFLFKQFNINVLDMMIVVIQYAIQLAFVVISIYVGLCVAHTKWIRKYKTGIAIIIFFAINLIVNVETVSMLIPSILNAENSLFNICFYTLFSLVFMLLSSYVLDHHIEIE